MITYLLLMLICFAITVTIETAVLLTFLSRRHPVRHRLFAGLWLTACTYPIVWLVLPWLIEERGEFLLAAETFAPLAECGLFWFAFIRPLTRNRRATIRDFVAIIVANLASFGAGELLRVTGGMNMLVGAVG